MTLAALRYAGQDTIGQPSLWVWDEEAKLLILSHPVLAGVGITHRTSHFPWWPWQFRLDSLSDLASWIFVFLPSKGTLFHLSLIFNQVPVPCFRLLSQLRIIPLMNQCPLAVLLLSLIRILSSSDVPHLWVLSARFLYLARFSAVP